MSFFELFSKASQPTPQATPAPAQQTNSNAGQGQGQPGGQGPGSVPGSNPIMDGNGNQPNAPQGLDLFQQLLQNKAPEGTQAPSLALKSDELAKIAQGIDFTSSISPESFQTAFQQAAQGDFSGFKALLNQIGQQAYVTSMDHSAKVTNSFTNDRVQFERNGLQGDMRKQQILGSLDSIKTLHPTAQEMFRNAAIKVADSMPNATAAEIEAKTWEFMEVFGGQFDRKAKDQLQRQQAMEPDWDKAFEGQM